MTEGTLVDETVLALDPDSLTIGDLEDFEEIVGRDLFEVLPKNEAEAEGWQPGVKVIKALVFLTQRRVNPDFTLADARNVKVTQLTLGASDSPTDAAG
jgi:hypothetical protein